MGYITSEDVREEYENFIDVLFAVMSRIREKDLLMTVCLFLGGEEYLR